MYFKSVLGYIHHWSEKRFRGISDRFFFKLNLLNESEHVSQINDGTQQR